MSSRIKQIDEEVRQLNERIWILEEERSELERAERHEELVQQKKQTRKSRSYEMNERDFIELLKSQAQNKQIRQMA